MRLEVAGHERVIEPEALVVIGYAGRDRAAVESHIEELAGLGVPRPPSVPMFMAFPPWLITQEPAVAVAGASSSGEAEIVVVVDGNETFVTLGSDHTDRVLESVDIAASKGVCPKPVAASAWPAQSLAGVPDGIRIRSWIDDRVPYQDGSAAANRPPLELVSSIPWARRRPGCFVAFTGTVPVIGDIRPSRHFQARLSAPGLADIDLSYTTQPISELASSS